MPTGIVPHTPPTNHFSHSSLHWEKSIYKSLLLFQRPVICDQLCGAEPQAVNGIGWAVGSKRHMGRALQQPSDGEGGPSYHCWGCILRYGWKKNMSSHGLCHTLNEHYWFCQADVWFCSPPTSQTGAIWNSQEGPTECWTLDARDGLGHRRIQTETQRAQNTLPRGHWEDVWWKIAHRLTPDNTYNLNTYTRSSKVPTRSTTRGI